MFYNGMEYDDMVVPDEEALLLMDRVHGRITKEEYEKEMERIQEEHEEMLRQAGLLAE